MAKGREAGAVGDGAAGAGVGRPGAGRGAREFAAAIKGEGRAATPREAAGRQEAQRLIAAMRQKAGRDRLGRALQRLPVRTYDRDVAAPTDRGAWKLGAGPRGYKIGETLGENLPLNNKTIDAWTPQTGEATSIKSHDLNAATIKDGKGFARVLKANIGKLSAYVGQRATNKAPEIKPGDIKERTLKVGLERGVQLTPAQREAMKEAVAFGKNLAHKVNVIFFRDNGPGTHSARSYRAGPGRRSDAPGN
jgi:hypothetical protein